MGESFRIVQEHFIATAFDGDGAKRYGGRWNSKGTSIVYTSSTPSLACLEIMANLDSYDVLRERFVIIRCEFRDNLCETVDVAALPKGWNADSPNAATRTIGDQWVKEGRSAILVVPSAVSPSEQNYLVNPAHIDFKYIRVSSPARFDFSSRFIKR